MAAESTPSRTVGFAGAPAGLKTPPPAPKVTVNRALPIVQSPSAELRFSANPTDEEISAAHVFAEPLAPTAPTTLPENKELAQALSAFVQRIDGDDFGAITGFLESHPNSPWRASLLTDLGIIWRHEGRFSKALPAWEEAWQSAKNATDRKAKAIADQALGELVELDARLGRYDQLQALLNEIKGRPINGAVSEKITEAREALWSMLNCPDASFRCGQLSLKQISASQGSSSVLLRKLSASRGTSRGTSLSSLYNLSKQLGLNYQMTYHKQGNKLVFPAVVHLKVGHYMALLGEYNGKYRVQDPASGEEIWFSEAALNAESSGYYLLPSGTLPQGWRSVSDNEGQNVWGRGGTLNNDPSRTGPGASGAGGDGSPGTPPGTPPSGPPPPPPSPPCPMAQYTIQAMLVSLHIWDTPVGYVPPRGLDMHFQLEYNQREAFQPTTFNYSNLGQKWTFNWLSYITDDPNNPGAPVNGYMQGGGTESYSGFSTNNNSYALQPDSHVILVMTSSNSYTRLSPNGYKQIYSWSDGSTAYPRNIFLTQVIDPAGNTLTLTYDGNNRIVAVTDAIGQVTTITYGSTDINNLLFYQIARVTDPFGRYATFQYNASGQLTNITDVIGITSQFTYGLSDDGTVDFITSMTTPYGTTAFTEGTDGRNRWLQAMDPLGQTERMEYDDVLSTASVPDYGQTPPSTIPPDGGGPAYLYFRNSFFWSKAAMQYYPDYSKARIFHWLHSLQDESICSGTEESVKEPLEGRTWFTYAGQDPYNTQFQGTNDSPSTVARVLDDGTSQVYQYQYNGFGNITQITDPAGRVTTNIYATNLIDLLSVQQQVGTNFQQLASFTYTTNHLPLTAVDAAGQTNFFSYNAFGQLTATTNALGQVTTMSYDTNDYLTNVTGALPGSTTSFTYDGYGRVRTITDSQGYTITTSYDADDRTTNVFYPDGTYSQTVYNYLDPVLERDRNGHWTAQVYDPLRHMTDVYDNLGRHTQFGYCSCGALKSITDPLGRVTTFVRDLESRVTTKIYPDTSQINYTYETNTSRLKMVTDARNQSTIYDYYVDDNPAQVTYSNAVVATPTISYTYDTNFNRIVSMTDGTGTTTYGYYPVNGQPGAGMLSSVSNSFLNSTITYTYDQLGRVINRSINGVAQALTYDALGRVTVITNALGGFTNTYLGATALVTTNFYPNGQTTVFSYYGTNNNDRLQQIQNLTPNGQNLSSFGYTYDPLSQITTWTQQTDTNSPNVYSYGYDAGNQLLSAVLSSTGPGATVLKQFAYDYDLAGNRTSEQIDTGMSQSTYNNLNQVTNISGGSGLMQFAGVLDKQATVTVAGNAATVNHQTTNFVGYANVTQGTNIVQIIATDYSGNSRTNNYQVVVTNNGVAETLTYDLNGNETSVVTATSTNTYQWDAANRLVQITQLSTNSTQQTSQFAYDGLGRRIQDIELQNGVPVSTNTFLWDGQALVEQRDNTGANVTKRFFGEGEQIAGVNYYFTRDHLGSVREMMDGAGTLHARYDYDPYGRQTKVSGDMDADFAFTGIYFHSVSGLYLTLFRAYDADLGRWLSRDPLAEKAGLNLYAYVANNPIRLADRDGRVALLIFGVALGVLFVGGLILAGYAMKNGMDEAANGNYNRSIELNNASNPNANATPTQNSQAINNSLANAAPDFFTLATVNGTLAGGPAGFIPDNAGDATISLAWSALQPDSSGTPTIWSGIAPYFNGAQSDAFGDPTLGLGYLFNPYDPYNPYSPFWNPNLQQSCNY